jgi:hypothetical protein
MTQTHEVQDVVAVVHTKLAEQLVAGCISGNAAASKDLQEIAQSFVARPVYTIEIMEASQDATAEVKKLSLDKAHPIGHWADQALKALLP